MDLKQSKLYVDATRICYVCGFNFDAEPINEQQKWPFIFCPCCTFEYGIDDRTFDCFISWRQSWIKKGFRFGMDLYPKNYIWTLDKVFEQLENLKLVDIKNYPEGIRMNHNYATEINKEEIRTEWYKHRENISKNLDE